MDNKKYFIITTVILGITALTRNTQAQDVYQQPFSGTVAGTYTFNDVSNGELETIISTTPGSLTSETDGEADFSVEFSVDTTFAVGLPQQISGPAITAKLLSISADAKELTTGSSADSSGGMSSMLPSGTVGEFDVGMSVSYDQPLVPGKYIYIVPVTFYPL